MRYCTSCGKKNDDLGQYCWSCGMELKQGNSEKAPLETTSSASGKSLASSTIKGIGIALLIIGIVGGILTIAFMGGDSGDLFGYDSWEYNYAGGKELGITMAIISAISLIVGLGMLIGASSSKKK